MMSSCKSPTAAFIALLLLSLQHTLAVDTLVKSVSVGSVSTCVVLEYDQVKCFGRGSYGRLGSGSTANLGDASNELGDNLPIVDLAFGSVAAVATGTDHACALSSAGEVKCWGYGYSGELGLEQSSLLIGDNSGEMGTNLAAVRLGTGRTATAIAAGDGHTCGILDNGSLKCWGYGGDGRLGQGSSSSIGSDANSMGDNLAPIDLGTGKTVKQVSTGGAHTCVILNDDSAKCFGNGQYGKLGSGATANLGDGSGEMGDNLAAINLGTGRTAKQVSAGGEHTCVLLDNDSVKCFGRNDKGQLGIDSTANKGTSASDMGDNLAAVNLGTGRTALAIACGQKVTCALLDNHEVKCWGQAANGQLMKGSSTANLGDASGEMGSLTSLNFGIRSSQVVAISLGVGGLYGHACAIYSSSLALPGTLMCWGNGNYGQLGSGATGIYGDSTGETGGSSIPVDVYFGTAPTKSPTATSSPTAPTTFGPTSSPTTSTPTTSPTTSAPSKAPSLRPTKSPTFSAPTASPIVNEKVIMVATGGESTCMLMEHEQIQCFGRGSYGRLGSGSTQNIGDTIEEMENLQDVDLDFVSVTSVSVGASHACAVSGSGELKCWGYGYNGELGLAIGSPIIGDSEDEMGANLPLVNLGIGRTVTQVSCGDGFTCVLLDAGDVKCFGHGSDGRLGQGSASSIGTGAYSMGDNLTAINLGTGYSAIQISAGGSHACAILDDSSVKCWGAGAYGQLGSKSSANLGDQPGEMGDNLTAIDLGTGRIAIQVAAGGQHTCVLLDDWSVKCFGRNDQGQLGLDSTSNKGSGAFDMGDNLTAVNLGQEAIAIAAGEKVSCALLMDNSLKCWGDGAKGQLMKGNTNDLGDNSGEMANLTPLNFGAHTNEVVSIAVGTGGLYGHACALLSESLSIPGNVVCWGNGQFGQRGSGNTVIYGDGAGEAGGDITPILVETGA